MEKKVFLFNKIAAIYGLFFNWQVRNYRHVLNNIKEELDFSTYQSIIDIGCGTGALCKVLLEYGVEVTGLDPAEAMLAIAAKKTGITKPFGPSIRFIHGDVLKGLPFRDQSFDLAITSYVAHGLMLKERITLYNEMKRIAKYTAILFDYNEHRSLITDIAEWLEGGDYFSFIKNIKDELMNQFGNLKVINTGKRSAMYICKIE
ncbi:MULTISPECIES: class I SAM-dependent methyltransferase [unclassified Dehalobacter]|uniref:class I SAM-dependent methyltransferase n=1 Tax=unclassified Dehalobacter TaxID=2635733 RepID=UPI00037DAF83|nr:MULTISPECIES: class I SAM-dependent methyltransferase [unclassified Dehalobacter]RJE48994.1 methyltransferase type 11 [Dehalobacter sp. MCB1]TCX51733.1 class I SAM-dependent methyltransferase [Dehalobacter sp. 14DCB1]TCX52793.1 class I SAM-dependent methyltransferase [Dehalobacter sp. 12DCB1]